LRKNRLKLELSSLRLTRGLPFEKGARALWEMVDDLEAMGAPVLGDLEGPGLDTTATSATTLTCTHTACKCSRG
jgi:hypothetical protein